MIPYFIQHANPSDDMRDNNIYIMYGSSEKDKMNEKIISDIINIMDEFCSEDGFNMKIISYDDFCDQYWKNSAVVISGWHFIFSVYYFENEWVEWNVEKYKEDIYNSYVNTFKNLK